MFYKVKIKDHIRVPPDLFTLGREQSILQGISREYEGFISSKLGFVVDVLGVSNVQEGVIVPGDGAAFYETEFELLTYRPELQEVVMGKVRDIADFGAFMTIGPVDGMIHISQTMDDFVSFSKDKTLQGKDSGRTLRPADKCRARIIAVSFKDPSNPKIGLTMRQEGLGRLEWIAEGPIKKVAREGGPGKKEEKKAKGAKKE